MMGWLLVRILQFARFKIASHRIAGYERFLYGVRKTSLRLTQLEFRRSGDEAGGGGEEVTKHRHC